MLEKITNNVYLRIIYFIAVAYSFGYLTILCNDLKDAFFESLSIIVTGITFITSVLLFLAALIKLTIKSKTA